jgi:FtsZ-binding cell division protein ZapB
VIFQIDELKAEVKHLTEQNQTLSEEQEHWQHISRMSSVTSRVSGTTTTPPTTPQKVFPVRSSSAVDLVDKLPPGGNLDTELLKQRVVASLQDKITKLQAEVKSKCNRHVELIKVKGDDNHLASDRSARTK